jgi:hypothetical protein
MDLVKAEPCSDSETCHDGNQVTYMKVEDIAGIQEEGHQILIPSPVIKAEQEVSIYVHC